MSKICDLYKEGRSAREIAKIMRRSYQTILNELHKNKITIRYSQKGKISKEFLIKEYLHDKKSTYQIGKETNRTSSIIRYWLNKYNIKIRKPSDYPNPMLNKERPDLSLRNRKNRGKNHPFYNKKRPEFSKKIKGKNHPNWKGGISSRTDKLRHDNWGELKEWSKKILRRDKYTCRICNKKGGDLEVHHIFPLGRFPELISDIDNGLTLCKECHIKQNAQSIKDLMDSIFKENETLFRTIEMYLYMKGNTEEKKNKIRKIIQKLNEGKQSEFLKNFEKILKEKPSGFKALEEFEKTGKIITKTRLNFTIDREIARKFREYCRKHRLNMSKLIEEMIKKKIQSTKG